MPQGSLNWTRFVRTLGLKNIVEMPIRETIQPVIPLDVGRGQIPVHSGSLAWAGGKANAAVAEYSCFELVSLDPGGIVILWVQCQSNVTWAPAVSAVPVTWGIVGPTDLPPVQFTDTPSISTMTSGTEAVPAFSLTTSPRMRGISEVYGGGFAPLHLPHGRRFTAYNTAANGTWYFTVGWCAITATEGGE